MPSVIVGLERDAMALTSGLLIFAGNVNVESAYTTDTGAFHLIMIVVMM